MEITAAATTPVSVAAKLREATKLIEAEQEVYAAAGYPVKIANCYANMLHFIGELDPDLAGLPEEPAPGTAVEL